MKNLLLGFSVAANIALAYMIFQDKDQMEDIKSRFDALTDQAEGKAKQVKGAITGDAGDKVSGNVDEGKGKVKEGVSGLKDKLTND